MSSMEETLKSSASLVKLIGSSVLPNGQTLRQFLSVDNVSCWDVFAVDMARIYVPPCLLTDTRVNFMASFIKPKLIGVRNFLRDRFESWQSRANTSIKLTDQPSIVILDFSDHISRDVISPLFDFIKCERNNNPMLLVECSKGYGATKHEEHINIWSYWGGDLIDEYESIRLEIKRRIRLLNNWNLKSLINQHEPNLYEKIEPALNRFLCGEINSLVRRVLLAKKIIHQLDPKILVVGDIANPKTRIYLDLCKEISIPTLALQFGMAGPASIEWKFLTADKVAVWGNQSKNALMTHGVDANSIVITGSPRNDLLHNSSVDDQVYLKCKWRIPSGPVILMASTFNMRGYESYSDPKILIDMKKTIFTLAKVFPNINLIVKPHPSESEAEVKALAGGDKNIFFIPKDADIRELISFCDCFISFGSTATTDAILARKIVVCPAFPGWIWSNLFVETGAVLAPQSKMELQQLFYAISRGDIASLSLKTFEKANLLVSDWFFMNDGKSARRVHDLILKILFKGKNVED